MVEIAGRPIIEHQLRWLADNGVREVVVSLGYQAEILRRHVGDVSEFGVSVRDAVESEPLGRGGGRRFAVGELAHPREPLFGVNGDVICGFPVHDMVELHRRLDAQVTVALARFRSNWGVVELDGEKITGFVQSPELAYWINADVYVLDPATIECLPERGDHEDTTFPELAAEGRLAGYRIDGYWRGIDTLKDVNEATRELREP
jgi:NDP-sugar pyrophosphorylase family protein